MASAKKIGRDAVRADVARAMRERYSAEEAEYWLQALDRAIAGPAALEASEASRISGFMGEVAKEAFPDRGEEVATWIWTLVHYPTFDRELPDLDACAFWFLHSVYYYYPLEIRRRGISTWEPARIALLSPKEWWQFVTAADPTFKREILVNDFTDEKEASLTCRDYGVSTNCADPHKQSLYGRYLALSAADRERVLAWVKSLWG